MNSADTRENFEWLVDLLLIWIWTLQICHIIYVKALIILLGENINFPQNSSHV